MRYVARFYLGLALLLASLAVSAPGDGQVTDFYISSYGVGGVVYHELFIDFDGAYTESQLLIELDSGFINNELAFGSSPDVPPSSGLVRAVPLLQFETYLAQGARFSDDPGHAGTPVLRGGAAAINPTETDAVFNNATKISQAWGPADGTLIEDRENFLVARFAVTPSASGVLRFSAMANGSTFMLNGPYEFNFGSFLPFFVKCADYNGNRVVEQGDLDLVLLNWGENGYVEGISGAMTGIADQDDLDRVLQRWGDVEAPDFGGRAVPEPAALGLLGLAGALGRLRAERVASLWMR